VIFAAIAEDFERMMRQTFNGYPKPQLTIEGGRPVSRRKPSRLGFVLRGLGQRWDELSHLRSMELWHALRKSSGAGEPDPPR
jgi:hypothetical protein